ncbi:MAG TPA: hypothetical protein VLD37_01295 [Candidatus Bilamarchaeum sp.]|nr:hypothetical protein [Candidatus Bilamarchaeum sp.]
MRFRAALLMIAFSALSFCAEGGSIENIHADPWGYLGLPNPLFAVYAASLVSGLAIFYAIFVKSTSEQAKKTVYLFISAPIIAATAYLAGSTLYLNLVSETKGPVHWHADYEVWACDREYELIDPTGIENRIGTPVVHEHNDNRIHVEGVLLKKEEASLRNFFVQAGGNFDNNSLTLPTNDGVMTWSDGDLCNGRSARWLTFVNGEPVDDGPGYVISPYTVDNGPVKIDRIKLVFTEKPAALINADIGGPP